MQLACSTRDVCGIHGYVDIHVRERERERERGNLDLDLYVSMYEIFMRMHVCLCTREA